MHGALGLKRSEECPRDGMETRGLTTRFVCWPHPPIWGDAPITARGSTRDDTPGDREVRVICADRCLWVVFLVQHHSLKGEGYRSYASGLKLTLLTHFGESLGAIEPPLRN